MSAEDLKKGATIAQTAFLIVLAIGIAEVIAASFATSIALLADGIQSIATSFIFLIVWIGIRLSGRSPDGTYPPNSLDRHIHFGYCRIEALRLSGRSPDGTFHFGYCRIEALGSLVAAFVLAIFACFILFEAYNVWIEQQVVTNAETAIIVASASAAVVLAVSTWINRASRRLGSAALRVGGVSGILDVLASVAVLIGVAFSKYLGILHADSIAGILIAGAIFIGTYSIFRESSLVLVDACNCGDTVGAIGEMARSIKGVKEVHSIRLRKLGSYLTGDMHVVVSSEMLVREADQIATEVEEKIKQMFDKVLDFKIRIESDEAHNKHAQELTIEKG
jgi:cation diffusion facilitator family transporter